MTQEQATIALRDAAESGGDYVIDTDKDRLYGQVQTPVQLRASGITFTLAALPVPPVVRRHRRIVTGARVLRVERFRRDVTR